jgi:hypothetical protein
MTDSIYKFKALSRLFHLLSASFFLGAASTIIFDLGSGKTVNTVLSLPLELWMWLLAMATGFGNLIMLIKIKKPQREAHSLWEKLLVLKLLLTILIHTPVA